jgi:hypothetical protein
LLSILFKLGMCATDASILEQYKVLLCCDSTQDGKHASNQE